jgi:methyl-accepting chemotaxis protein
MHAVKTDAVEGKLAGLRLASETVMLTAIWAHGPVLAVAGWLAGGTVWLAMALWAVATATATVAHRGQAGAPATRATLAACLCVLPALLVMELAGTPWQIDAHMLFFAEVAATAMLLDWQAIIVGAAVVAVHHLALNFLLPELVFPGGAAFFRVVFHAVVLVLECVSLAWLVDQASGALVRAEAAAVEIQTLAEQRQAEQARVAAQASAAQLDIRTRTADAFEAKIGTLIAAVSAGVGDLRDTAQAMSATAAQANDQANLVAGAAGQASAGVQTVAAAAEELSVSITEISRQVTQSSRVAQQAVTDARRTDGIVRALAEGAAKISQVVELISNIAGQTNLLALNATIEAARAGDAGKGFAVVASEVKSLALQTAKATQDIGAQIEQIQRATAEAVQAIQGINGTIEEVSAIATTIAAAIEEQGAATAEIARNVQQTAASTQDVTANIGGVSETAGRAGDAATRVLGSAGSLSDQAVQLNEEVGRFVAGMRAA